MAKPLSNLEDHVGYWLRFVSNHVSYGFTRKVEAKGVTVAEWVVLRQLYDADDASPSELAERLGMTRGAVSKLIDRLCQKKLATRTSSDVDRRRQTVRLTAAGRRLTPALAKLADENDAEFFGHLSSKQKGSLVRQLKDMVRLHGWKDAPVD